LVNVKIYLRGRNSSAKAR